MGNIVLFDMSSLIYERVKGSNTYTVSTGKGVLLGTVVLKSKVPTEEIVFLLLEQALSARIFYTTKSGEQVECSVGLRDDATGLISLGSGFEDYVYFLRADYLILNKGAYANLIEDALCLEDGELAQRISLDADTLADIIGV